MKRIFLFLSLLCALAACKDSAREVVQRTSPNGFPYHYIHIDEDGVTDSMITIAWPSNWAYEEGVNPAVPMVGTEAIKSGAPSQMSQADLLEFFEDKNSNADLAAGPGWIYGEVGFTRSGREETLEVVSDMLANPQFDTQWVDRIKAQQKDTFAQIQKNKINVMWAELRKKALGDGPLYQYLTFSDVTLFDEVRLEDLQTWHAQTFTRSNAIVSVAGAITAEQADEAVDQLLGSLPESVPVSLSKVEMKLPEQPIIVPNDGDKHVIAFAGQLPSVAEGGDHLDLLAMHLLAGESGPLFAALRDELRAAYGIDVLAPQYDTKNRLFVMASVVETEKAAEAQMVLLETYEAFRTNPELSRLADIKERIATGTAKNLSYVDIAARTLREALIVGDDPNIAISLHERFQSATEEDIKERFLTAFPPASQMTSIELRP